MLYTLCIQMVCGNNVRPKFMLLPSLAVVSARY